MNKKYWGCAFAMAFTLLAVSSCNDDFLDRKPQASVTAETYFKTEGECLKGVNAVYDVLQLEGTYDVLIPVIGDGASDDVYASGGEWQGLTSFTVTPFDPLVNRMWSSFYIGITRANAVIEKVPQATLVEEKLRNRIVGEAKFLRALYYFNLVNIFGGVPLVTKSLVFGQDEFNLPRNTREEVYAQIEKDLQEAIPVLWKRSEYAPADLGRVTQGAAQTLLAKAYLYQQKWAQAAEAANAVITSGEYQLNKNFRQNFTISGENSPESIFEVQNADIGTGWSDSKEGGYLPQLYAPSCGSGWSSFTPTNLLEEAFEPGDPRLPNTIVRPDDVLDGNKMTCRGPAKHWDFNTPKLDNDPLNQIIFRLADVLLVRAEALLLAGGSTQEVIGLINTVRQRARTSVSPAAAVPADRSPTETDRTKIMEWLREERRLELAFEHQRFFDLVRWGIAGKVLRAGDFKKNFEDGKNEIYPIPQTQIDLHRGQLEQNPKYN